jgi:hypothetical protein
MLKWFVAITPKPPSVGAIAGFLEHVDDAKRDYGWLWAPSAGEAVAAVQHAFPNLWGTVTVRAFDPMSLTDGLMDEFDLTTEPEPPGHAPHYSHRDG